FMTADGGLQSAERLFVNEMPGTIETTIEKYYPENLATLCCDHPGDGFTVVLLPAFSAIHEIFAKTVSDFPGLHARPLIGWVSGVALGDVGRVAPKIFDGRSGRGS